MGMLTKYKTIKELLINTKYEKYIEVLDKRNIRTVHDYMSYRYSDGGYMRISNYKLQSYLKDCIGDDLYGIIDLVDNHRNTENRKDLNNLKFIWIILIVVIFLCLVFFT